MRQAGGNVTASGVTVNALGNGVQAVTNGTLSFTNGTITSNAIGIRASQRSAVIRKHNRLRWSTGGVAGSGSTVTVNGSTIQTTATTTANSAGQVGLRATGAGGVMNASGSLIIMGPPKWTTTANNMIGASKQPQASAQPDQYADHEAGGTSGTGNYGLVATGAGSTTSFLGGSIADGVPGTVRGVGTRRWRRHARKPHTGRTIDRRSERGFGSHAVYATGADSHFTGSRHFPTTSGALASGVRAAKWRSDFTGREHDRNFFLEPFGWLRPERSRGHGDGLSVSLTGTGSTGSLAAAVGAGTVNGGTVSEMRPTKRGFL